MGRARIWNLRLNLDAFNAAFATLDDDQERSQFLAGLSRGMNGGVERTDPTIGWSCGFALGSTMRNEAEGFRERKSMAGQASADARRTKHGTAQPNRSRTVFEDATNRTRTNPQSTIDNPENEKSTEPGIDSPLSPLTGGPERADQEHDDERGSSTTPAEVVRLWNTKTEGTPLPKASLTPQRERLIRTRLTELGWLDAFGAACAFLAGSSWHQGANEQQWVASIDHVLKEGKAVELAERGAAPPPARRGPRNHRSEADDRYRAQLLAEDASSRSDAGGLPSESLL